ncbi:U-box domain-containing protein 43 [Linum grandiflorum]
MLIFVKKEEAQLCLIGRAFNINAVTFCRDHNLAGLFIELLQSNGLDNVQRSSAMALENLSQETKNLTRLPDVPAPKFCSSIFPCFSRQPVITGLCRLHRGTCSLNETFCLLEGQGVEKLVALLDHNNEMVVEAALAAVCTLLEDGVDVEQGMRVLLYDAEGIRPILDVLIERRTENLRRRGVWAVERLLRFDDIANEVSGAANLNGGSQPSFVACSSVPRLPRLMPAPIIIQHLGEIYVVYGQLRFNECRKHLNTEIESEELLREVGKGCKLCVSLAGQLNSYDIKKNECEEMSDLYWHQKGIITLSLYPEAEDEVCYVVIIPKLKGEHRGIDAALVDEVGNRSHIQLLHQVTGNDEITSFKLIELEFEKKDPYNGSSTFALVFNSDDKMIGLTVIKVSISVFGAKKVK